MDERAHVGKMIFGALAVIVTAWCLSQIVLRVVKSLIAFCAVYDREEVAEPLFFDEIEEQGTEGR